MHVIVWCPRCDGQMEIISYEVTIKILKQRSWLYCRGCRYEIEMERFKKTLLTV